MEKPYEKWAEIKGYEKKYAISTHGNIISLNYEGNTNEARPMKLSLRKDGYLQVRLSKDKKEKSYLVHRLVAETFIENPNAYQVVNHINGIKTDNNVENLEWCTQSKNMLHAYANNLHKKFIGKENWNSKKVLQFDRNNNFIRKFNSIKEATKETKSKHISECCLGKRKLAGGFIWKYEEL